MSSIAGGLAIAIIAATAAAAVGMTGQETGPAWLLVVCATALPAIAAIGAARRSLRFAGRERAAWRALAASMGAMIPIYFLEHIAAFTLEDILITVAYGLGGIAILLVPLPDSSRYQRLVASLDALGIGLIAAVGTSWMAAGSEVAVAGHVAWVIADAVIIAMVAYVAVRRSQRRGIDWPLFLVIAGVGGYVGGVLVSSGSDIPYHLGHPADYAYVVGMAAFALAPLAPEPRRVPQQILAPLRWGHVVAPYGLVAFAIAAFIANELGSWGDDPMRSSIELGLAAITTLVLVRQLVMIAEQRQKIDREQSGVIATISHEMRTPLTTIVGFLDLLEEWESYTDEEKMQMVTMIREESRVLDRVVGDLVDVARERIDQLELRKSTFRVKDFLDNAVLRVPQLRDTSLHIDVARDAVLTADPERMLQIVANFLANAAIYGSGRVDIAAFEAGGDTVIEVHDDGPGVPDLYQSVIWERFERGHHRQSSVPGSGIGLSVARGLARSHGGEALYRPSERLGGSCFSVRIPVPGSVLDELSHRPRAGHQSTPQKRPVGLPVMQRRAGRP